MNDVYSVRTSTIVRGSRNAIWDAWSTRRGLEAFFAPEANIRLEAGGPYELFFRDGPEGKRGSEKSVILSFFPPEYICFTWNAPPEFPREREIPTRVVVEIDKHDDEHYKVTLTHTGFGEDGQWPAVHAYFERVWPNVLESLKSYIEAVNSDEEPRSPP